MAQERPIRRAVKPMPALVGTEDIHLVEQNRLFNHGYKHFLTIAKIRDIFGDRIANSKKVRKARVREILKNTMHTIEQDDMNIVNDFIKEVEAKLREHIAEVQAMKSSAATVKTSPVAAAPSPSKMEVDVVPVAASRRRRRSPSDGQAKNPSMPMEVEVLLEKRAVNPLENQIDFLTQMMKGTDPNKPTNITVRQIERDFKKAKKADEEALKNEQIQLQRAEKARIAAERKHLKQIVKDDLADLFSKTGVSG